MALKEFLKIYYLFEPSLSPLYPEDLRILLHQSIFLKYQLIVVFNPSKIFVFGSQPISFFIKLLFIEYLKSWPGLSSTNFISFEYGFEFESRFKL